MLIIFTRYTITLLTKNISLFFSGSTIRRRSIVLPNVSVHSAPALQDILQVSQLRVFDDFQRARTARYRLPPGTHGQRPTCRNSNRCEQMQ